jgi:predicted Zn finger-like uncharacterized protein
MEIVCPACQRPLHVQEEHVGWDVKCPACGQVFTVGAPEPAAPQAEGRRPPPSRPFRRRRRPKDRDVYHTLVMPPAIGLIALGGLVAIFELISLLMLLAGDQSLGPERFLSSRLARSTFRGLMFSCTCFPLMGSAVIIVGGVKMLQCENRRFVLSACITAMIPCTSGWGCFFGIPLGIWSLIVIRREDVAQLFKDERSGEEMETEF